MEERSFSVVAVTFFGKQRVDRFPTANRLNGGPRSLTRSGEEPARLHPIRGATRWKAAWKAYFVRLKRTPALREDDQRKRRPRAFVYSKDQGTPAVF